MAAISASSRTVEATAEELQAFWAKQKQRMYSVLPQKVDKYVSTTHAVSLTALETPPASNPHAFGWLCQGGAWYAAWYPELSAVHHKYVYKYQCVVIPVKGSLYLPRTRGKWFHFEDAPKEVTELLQEKKKLPTYTKGQRTYKKEFWLSYKRCKEYYEAAKKRWFEEQKTLLPVHQTTTLCVGDILTYSHVLPNFQTQIIKIDPPVYYESEKEFVYAKLRAIHVADMGGSIMGGHGGQEEKLRITKLLSNGDRVIMTSALWNIEPEGLLKGSSTFEDAVCEIATSTQKSFKRKLGKVLAETESESDTATDSESDLISAPVTKKQNLSVE